MIETETDKDHLEEKTASIDVVVLQVMINVGVEDDCVRWEFVD